ncbi:MULTISPECIES: aldehyde dehydrogenase family protein [unclassified Pseudomonas]|uniref:aldehyde dehydrogenase family protein n=1 Tax=unclassified Pseudomonas TaxID=196821 RepID=UPI000BD26466|nr:MULTISPECIES: aldehyde dehydrogenase family protein [unclassified Pseudomonas]PVZ20630.1 succinate-semialdehyde dehydrogenase [Pseudomonas sp. URIL14HWK12:I12]PVZ27696.1 succinate-semialdehyde dehydrogenase [Pseudomonas sp. URIL14HWK12:I10]PVZ38585.1 succinate-semialdehyde dehydrogenase [Pseudomonas sp. URIL14HWK12:I11]SNZ02770.1 succinate-semialdehyde dehydrogenase [Pseudomonas sp. URIL14HWK12:I9]
MTAHAISRNPHSGEELARYPFESDAQLDTALAGTAAAQRQWARTPLAQRVQVLQQLAQALLARLEPLAQMITAEMGKPIAQARAEVQKCAAMSQWYAEHGPAFLAPQPAPVAGQRAWLEFRPLGTVLAVMPWNFPLWQVLRGAVPMLLAGNAYMLKHAPNVMGSAYLLREVFEHTDLPAGAFEVINVEPAGVSRAIADPRIAAVAVTGSGRAGAAIAAQAGAVLKKCILELGGSDPFIVLEGCDLDAAVQSAVVGRYQNTGQVCMAAKRLIVEQNIAEAFQAKFLEAVRALKVGDPTAEEHYIGPMARYDLRDELHGQVSASLEQGASLLLGGEPLPGVGNYYAPTVLGNVQPHMVAFRQELFGPVAALISARDAEHALELANDSDFGLCATVWGPAEPATEALAARLETGGVFINGNAASDPRIVVGGVKQSGYGRELSSYGVHEFCNVQTVWVGRR